MIVASLSKQFAIFFFQHFIPFVILFFIIFSFLLIVFFLLLVRNKILYIEEITKTLDKISEGNLAIDIPVRTTDELGKMAKTVNNMACKLKLSIEEERRLEKTKNDLITNMSHDLRTPLTSTLGYLELITQMDYKDEEKLRQYSNIAYQQCKDLKNLIDGLFEYSKLSNSELKINKTSISLGEFLEQVVLTFMPALSEAEMEYRLFFINEKIIIEADTVLLARVFDNLISNAIKYGREGKFLDIRLDKENDEAVVQIINYGNSISDTDLPYVFEKFYRADKARSGHNEGSGLGLAIVKSIMEMHKGTIGTSRSDNKTVFEARFKIYDGVNLIKENKCPKQ